MITEMAIEPHSITCTSRSSISMLLLISVCAALHLQPAVAVNTRNDFSGHYIETYPCPSVNLSQSDCTPGSGVNRTCPLYIALMMSFGGEYDSSGVIASVQYALNQINENRDLLPGYKLHYTLTDTQCNRTVSLRAFHTQIINPPTKIAAIGSGCSIATEASAEVSHFYNITQLSCVSSSAALANRVKYPSYFQLLAQDADLADGFLAIIKQFKWKRVALIVQEENLLTVTMDRLKKALEDNEIMYSEKRFESEKGIESLGENLFDPEARIFIVAMYEFRAQHLMCKAHEHGILYPKYTFLFYGWFSETWWIGTAKEQENLRQMYPDCTSEQRASVLPYSLAPLQAEFLEHQDESTVISSGINGTQYKAEYRRYVQESHLNLTENPYSQQCYDATWALAYALNDTLTECTANEEGTDDCLMGMAMTSDKFGLHRFQYNDSQILQKVKGHLEETDFTGITGNIKFDRSTGVRRVGRIVVLSYQPCQLNDTDECVFKVTEVGNITMTDNGTTDFNFINGEDIWGSAGVPYDGVPITHLVTVNLPLSVFYIVLGAVGILFAMMCLCFNFKYRNNPLIRLTSPNLNYLIVIGAIILYIDTVISVVPTGDRKGVTILCNLTPWLNAIGYSLCFGTIVVKMFRVYYIFSNPTPARKIAVRDWMLALVVLSLVGIDILILAIFMVVEGVRGGLGAIVVQNREKPMSTEGDLEVVNIFNIAVCKSKSRDIALGVLYGYKGLLQIIAILFAFSIRKVKVKGLDDAKYIAIAVYVTSIVTAVIIVATYTLYDFSNTLSVVLCSGIFIGATIILLLVFVPNMIALYKDPEGTSMFTKQQPASPTHQFSSRSPHQLSYSMKPQSTDKSTTTGSEVESLKGRIHELESRLASIMGAKCSSTNDTHGIDHKEINME